MIDRSSIQIVPFKRELSTHFYRLNEQWLRKYFCVEDIDHRVLSNPQVEILDRGGQILFALLGEEVVGTCALNQEEPGHYELAKMAVDERYQGSGIGKRLLEAAIEEFHRRGGRVLSLETSSKLGPALHLYEGFGFKRQASPKPGSGYRRADVYMIWQSQE